MCSNPSNLPGNNRTPVGGVFGSVLNDVIKARKPTINPVNRTFGNSAASAPAAPLDIPATNSLAAFNAANAATAASKAANAKKTIADSFLGTTEQPTQKPESGYKVVG